MYSTIEEITPILENKGYLIKDPWDIVRIFEEKVATYAGSKYAVSVDNCTDALFLCLKFLGREGSNIAIPRRTYMSVPATIINAGYKVQFINVEWSGKYRLLLTHIIDGAARFTKGMYTPATLHCLSFHKKKTLAIGKGGMILTDSETAYNWLVLARYSGRDISVPFTEMPEPTMYGWNMYMPPEQAAYGLKLFYDLPDYNEDVSWYKDYPDLSSWRLYQ